MTKKIYLEPQKSVLGHSILHYCLLERKMKEAFKTSSRRPHQGNVCWEATKNRCSNIFLMTVMSTLICYTVDGPS